MSTRGPSSGSRSGAARGEPFVDHDAVLAYLNSRANFERMRRGVKQEPFKLDRIRAIMAALGNPQNTYPVVHIAGSKGKGSTCMMLESILRACGYTPGLFTSPHLVDERERVIINGAMITHDLFRSCMGDVKAAAESVAKAHGDASYFEIMTALMLLACARAAVDIAILETGLGGRLDCTNIVDPAVVGLTSIQLEHTDILGDTLELIAAEKAGIMKPGAVAYTVPQDEKVLDVFRARAKEVGCTLRVLSTDILYSCRFQSSTTRGPHPRVCVGDGEGAFEHLSVPMLGEHQAPNCGLALAIALQLREQGFDLPERRVIAGLESTPRAGRLELIHERPMVMVDGAHTPTSIKETLRAAGQQLEYDSLVVIFGCASDKDIDGMLAELGKGADKIVFTRSAHNPRAADPKELCERYRELTPKMCEYRDDIDGAITAAAAAVTGADLILATGSFYIAGEVKAAIHRRVSRET